MLLWGSAVVLLLVLLGLAWLAFSAFRVRSDLQAVRRGVQTMRSQLAAGNLTAAEASAKSIRSHADSAHSWSTGPAWALAADVPGLGSPFATARDLTTSVHIVANGAITPLVDAISTFQPQHIRTPDGAFNLAKIRSLGPTVDHASGAVTTAISRLHNASGSTWLGAVNTARSELLDQLSPLDHDLTTIGNAVKVVPTVLGADGPRTYLISFQNDAEIRSTGGIPGAFAIVRADNGKVTFTRFESDTYFTHVQARGLHLGLNYLNLFQTAQEDYRDSDYSPNFPDAGQIWSSMWQQKTGQTLNGAMIIDPTALHYLLQVSGPAKLADGSSIDASNVVRLTQQTLYQRYPDNDSGGQQARKNYLLDVARAISQKLLGRGVDSGGLLRAAATAADQHRLLFWSADQNVEHELATVPLGGVVPDDTKSPYVALGLNNDSQSKLDYYLHADMKYTSSCDGDSRNVTVTVTLTNDAPPHLPPYVEGGSDPPGTETLDVYLYGSIGGHFRTVTVDGKRPFHLIGTDQGHPVYYAAAVNVPPNDQPVTLVYHLTEPPASGPVEVRDQPMINPMTTTVSEAPCK